MLDKVSETLQVVDGFFFFLFFFFKFHVFFGQGVLITIFVFIGFISTFQLVFGLTKNNQNQQRIYINGIRIMNDLWILIDIHQFYFKIL